MGLGELGIGSQVDTLSCPDESFPNWTFLPLSCKSNFSESNPAHLLTLRSVVRKHLYKLAEEWSKHPVDLGVLELVQSSINFLM